MTTGYFQTDSAYRKPYIDIEVSFPDAGNRSLVTAFLIDTGADSTMLSFDILVYIRNELGIDFFDLPVSEKPISGVGGYVRTRTIRATLTIGNYSTTMPAPIHGTAVGRACGYAFPAWNGHTPRLRSLCGIPQRQGDAFGCGADGRHCIPLAIDIVHCPGCGTLRALHRLLCSDVLGALG